MAMEVADLRVDACDVEMDTAVNGEMRCTLHAATTKGLAELKSRNVIGRYGMGLYIMCKKRCEEHFLVKVAIGRPL
jgi:hypothetical protein